MRQVVAVLLGSAFAFLSGYRWGSDKLFPFHAPLWLAIPPTLCIAGTVIGATRLSPQQGKWLVAVVAVIAAVSATGVGVSRGDRAFHHAYNSCIRDGASVQADLRAHHEEHGTFPDELNDLGRPLPCQVPGRGTILEYHRSPTGYRISFGDWLCECIGTEVEPLACHK